MMRTQKIQSYFSMCVLQYMVPGPAGPPGLRALLVAAVVTTNAHAPVAALRLPLEGTSVWDSTPKRPCVTPTPVMVSSHVHISSEISCQATWTGLQRDKNYF